MTSCCQYCRVEFDRADKRRRYTRDHVWPRSRFVQPNSHGRPYLRRALNYTVAACAACNTDKGVMTLREWRVTMSSDDPRVPNIEAVIRRFRVAPPTKPGSHGEFESPALVRRVQMAATDPDEEARRLRMFYARMESLARVPGGSLPGVFASVAVECGLATGDRGLAYHPSSHAPTEVGARALIVGRGLLEEGA